MLGSPRRIRACAVAALTLLAVGAPALAPSTAAAQSAGDQQYQDPLGDDPGAAPERAPEPAPDGDGQVDASPAPPPATPAAPAAPAAPTASAAPSGAGSTLPRTGAEPAPLAAIGLGLLLAGALTRLRAGGLAHGRPAGRGA